MRRKRGKKGRRQIEKFQRSDGGRADIPQREMNEKSLISTGVYRLETFPTVILRGEAYVPASLSPSLRRHIHTLPHFTISDIGVTTAFYKVRDSSAKMCIRIPPLFCPSSPLSSPLTRFSSSVFPRAIVFVLRVRVPWCAIAMRFNFYSMLHVVISHNFYEIQTPHLVS